MPHIVQIWDQTDDYSGEETASKVPDFMSAQCATIMPVTSTRSFATFFTAAQFYILRMIFGFVIKRQSWPNRTCIRKQLRTNYSDYECGVWPYHHSSHGLPYCPPFIIDTLKKVEVRTIDDMSPCNTTVLPIYHI